jgi:hypothetical protein
MQCLLLTGAFSAGIANAIYLPLDRAAIPFGDPLAATVTSAGSGSGAAGGVVTIPGYTPANGDAISLSIAGTTGFLSSLSALTSQAQPNTTYYVSSASGETFSFSSVKASAGSPAGVIAVTSTLGQNGGQLYVHLLSNQPDGPVLPFKPNNTVLAMNLPTSAFTTTNQLAITLFGCNDVSSILATGVYGAPLGPNGSATTGWNVIATVGAGQAKLIQLSYDWIVASASSNSLLLIQN